MSSGTDEKQFAERLRIAREFKRTSGGAPLTSEVLGEPEPSWARKAERKPKPKSERDAEKHRQYMRQWMANHKQAIARRRMRECDGTYGISIVPHTSSGHVRFRSYCEKVVIYDCALDAANARNEFVKHRFAGMPEFRIELDAVWRKYGCNCGKHRRPSE